MAQHSSQSCGTFGPPVLSRREMLARAGCGFGLLALADLLRHGLLQASFIPPVEIRELREKGGNFYLAVEENRPPVHPRTHLRRVVVRDQGEPDGIGEDRHRVVEHAWSAEREGARGAVRATRQ